MPARGRSVHPVAFQSIIEQSVVGIYVVQDERLVYVNPRLAEMFGRPAAELLELPSVLLLVHEADRDRIRQRLVERVEGQRETSSHSMRGLRPDGRPLEVEVHSRRIMHDGRPAVTGTMIDVTDRRHRERELAERERVYRDLVENAADPLFTCDLDGRITSLNRAGERLTGFSRPETGTLRLSDLVAPSERATVERLLLEHDGDDRTAEVTLMTREGTARTLEVSTQAIRRDGVVVGLQGMARDVTARKAREQALQSLSIVDDLTKLYNRRGFLTLAERHLKLAARRGSGVFLLFADLDDLKQINDTHGHLAGDRALSETAEILRTTFRSADIIARLGGDEFTVFPLEASGGSAELLQRRVAEQVAVHNARHSGRGYALSLSVGVARFEPSRSSSIGELLDQADRALYLHKRSRQPSAGRSDDGDGAAALPLDE